MFIFRKFDQSQLAASFSHMPTFFAPNLYHGFCSLNFLHYFLPPICLFRFVINAAALFSFILMRSGAKVLLVFVFCFHFPTFSSSSLFSYSLHASK